VLVTTDIASRPYLHEPRETWGRDRAAVIEAALRQILSTAQPDELQRRREDHLLDELADIARQIAAGDRP
jgi:hypothetical protein